MISSEAKDFLTNIINIHAKTLNEKFVETVIHKDEEDKKLNDKSFPFVSLLTADGDFDERFAKTSRYKKPIPESLFPEDYKKLSFNVKEEDKEAFADAYSLNENEDLYLLNDLSADEKNRLIGILTDFGYNKLYSINIRGAAKCQIEIRVWTDKEKDSNKILRDIVRNIPDKWRLGDFEGKITIGKNGTSDWISSKNSNVTSNLRGCVLSFCYVDFYMDVGTDPEELPTVKTFSYDQEEDND